MSAPSVPVGMWHPHTRLYIRSFMKITVLKAVGIPFIYLCVRVQPNGLNSLGTGVCWSEYREAYIVSAAAFKSIDPHVRNQRLSPGRIVRPPQVYTHTQERMQRRKKEASRQKQTVFRRVSTYRHGKQGGRGVGAEEYRPSKV